MTFVRRLPNAHSENPLKSVKQFELVSPSTDCAQTTVLRAFLRASAALRLSHMWGSGRSPKGPQRQL